MENIAVSSSELSPDQDFACPVSNMIIRCPASALMLLFFGMFVLAGLSVRCLLQLFDFIGTGQQLDTLVDRLDDISRREHDLRAVRVSSVMRYNLRLLRVELK